MTTLIRNWNSVMDSRYNPLKHMDLAGRHYFKQILAWMWSMIFSVSVLSIVQFGIVWLSHLLIIGGIFLTYEVFYRATKRHPALSPVPELSHASKCVWKMDQEA